MARCRFFERLPNRLDADGLEQAQHHQLVGQHLQGPVATPLGRIAARQLDQLLLKVPFDLDLVRSGRLGLAIERDLQALGDEVASDPRDGAKAGT
jgi:hypothetical protein